MKMTRVSRPYPIAILHRVLDSVRTRKVQSYLRSLLLSLPVATHELLASVVTRGDIDVSDWCSDATRYQPMPYHLLHTVLTQINSDDVFVDLGCGKGRVLWFVGTRCKLKRIMGIEIVPELARSARKNMAKSRLLTPVTIVE